MLKFAVAGDAQVEYLTNTMDALDIMLPDMFRLRNEAHAPLEPGASKEDRLGHIAAQLDCFGPNDNLVEKYFLLGPEERHRGGQAVVKFAAMSNRQEVAIKLFAKKQEFEEEVDVYRNSPLRFFMPTVLKYVTNEDGAARDPFGGVMAPFIVMEKGESLKDRALKSQD